VSEKRLHDSLRSVMVVAHQIHGDFFLSCTLPDIGERDDAPFALDVAQPQGRPPTSFRLIESSQTRAVFENKPTTFLSASSTGSNATRCTRVSKASRTAANDLWSGHGIDKKNKRKDTDKVSWTLAPHGHRI
jgi:hypothetical protein